MAESRCTRIPAINKPSGRAKRERFTGGAVTRGGDALEQVDKNHTHRPSPRQVSTCQPVAKLGDEPALFSNRTPLAVVRFGLVMLTGRGSGVSIPPPLVQETVGAEEDVECAGGDNVRTVNRTVTSLIELNCGRATQYLRLSHEWACQDRNVASRLQRYRVTAPGSFSSLVTAYSYIASIAVLGRRTSRTGVAWARPRSAPLSTGARESPNVKFTIAHRLDCFRPGSF
ncbi:unnamed protein product, partial [Iphiclides podalirius]